MSDFANTNQEKDYIIERYEELRIIVGNEPIEVTLKSDKAEIFGIELIPDMTYKFVDTKFSIYTYHGCKIKIVGTPKMIHIERENPNLVYINIHGQLQSLRDEALRNKSSGPRIMIIGPTDVGKSTICRTLVSYAVRCGTNPIFVDLDVGQSDLVIPGTISASIITKDSLSIYGNLSGNSPLCYFYGKTSPSDTVYYEMLMSKLAISVNKSSESSVSAKTSGIIVNTFGWITGLGLDLLKKAITQFNINIVIVISDDYVFHELYNQFGRRISVTKMGKSGGVSEKDKEFRSRNRNNSIRKYFYGTIDCPLSPPTDTYSFSSVNFYKIVKTLNDSALLPIETKSTREPYKVEELKIEELKNEYIKKIASISAANDPKEILTSNSLGFVQILNVDINNESVELLLPKPGQLPSHFLVLGDIEFQNQ